MCGALRLQVMACGAAQLCLYIAQCGAAQLCLYIAAQQLRETTMTITMEVNDLYQSSRRTGYCFVTVLLLFCTERHISKKSSWTA